MQVIYEFFIYLIKSKIFVFLFAYQYTFAIFVAKFNICRKDSLNSSMASYIR